jgi:uncharacterized protein
VSPARKQRIAILLPPSEGKAEGGRGKPWVPEAGTFGAALAAHRAAVVSALAAAGGGDEKLLGVGGRHLDRAVAANVAVGAGRARTVPAWQRYTGVVYDHLDPTTLPADALKVAAKDVIVLSGLLGAVALGDPVPDYRLKMGASLPPLGKLASWWKPRLSPVLDEVLARRLVIDLLPQEHRAAWGPDPSLHVVKVGFVERAGPQRRMSSHDAKAAKGLLVRHLLLTGGDPMTALASFDHDRFALDID